ncbi:hypothetical protein TSUD_221150 [Trifolium subterraneum]|uniref:Peptidase metallopeptidase domain-containing protein n=1 Tax=Trifolium subterraneum TaxID=3900 RepID=A0A2Z6M594_TRISU|nr:hypothetical protein TSUD_221150 [Trifolium subterraneum]
MKQYLFDFGYLQQAGPYDNSLDEETISAIKTYQKTFNLQDNGFLLNNQTLQQILLPRCGVPDINFEYGFSRTNYLSWPKGNKWLRKDTKLLTYGFAPESNVSSDMIEVFKNALMRWSTTTMVLNFTEATSYDVANIKIGFYISNEGVEDVVVGDSVIILQNSYTSGVIRLNASKYWLLPTDKYPSWEDDEFDLETGAMHQIGHLLGLDHSFETDSIMYPIINQRKVDISDSDIANTNQLYNDANYGNFGSSASSLVTSLFLGFAFLAMFN